MAKSKLKPDADRAGWSIEPFVTRSSNIDRDAEAHSAKAEAVRHVRKHAGKRSPVEAAVSRIQRGGEGSQSDDPNGQAHA
jgi:hypothetical protein